MDKGDPPVAVATSIQQQPQMQQQPQVVVVSAAHDVGAPPGAPPGGIWIEESYCGTITCIASIVCFYFMVPCLACCCPCDKRTVYIVSGEKYTPQGARVQGNCCC